MSENRGHLKTSKYTTIFTLVFVEISRTNLGEGLFARGHFIIKKLICQFNTNSITRLYLSIGIVGRIFLKDCARDCAYNMFENS